MKFHWMKSWVIIVFFFMSLSLKVIPSEAGFLYQVKVLDKEAVSKLSDEELLKDYVDMLVEVEATRTFYTRSGFGSPREYEQYRALLRYRIYLLWEIENRKLPVPDSLKY